MIHPAIYSIGHSTHPISYFLELLHAYGVNCVVDVRSLPASRFNPQYNKKALARTLEENGIVYHHFGEEFGARQTDPGLLNEEGRVDFQKMRESMKFKKAVAQLKLDTERGSVIALMCSESEPLNCHRFSMISPALHDFEIRHILKDKSIVSQIQLEEQLLKHFSSQLQPDIFRPLPNRDDQLRAAYALLNKEIAFSPVTQSKSSRK
jgi:uncharacterized protein (DUF488 family)